MEEDQTVNEGINGNNGSASKTTQIRSLYHVLELIHILSFTDTKNMEGLIQEAMHNRGISCATHKNDERFICRVLRLARDIGFSIEAVSRYEETGEDFRWSGSFFTRKEGLTDRIDAFEYILKNAGRAYLAAHYLLDYLKGQSMGVIDISKARDIIDKFLSGDDNPCNGQLQKQNKGKRRLKRRIHNPLLYYQEHYAGLTRGQLQREDPSLYQMLRKSEMLEHIPLQARL